MRIYIKVDTASYFLYNKHVFGSYLSSVERGDCRSGDLYSPFSINFQNFKNLLSRGLSLYPPI